MKIGTEQFRQMYMKYTEENYDFIYTTGGFGWVKKKPKKTVRLRTIVKEIALFGATIGLFNCFILFLLSHL